MNDFLLAISQNINAAVLCSILIMFCFNFPLRFYKLKRMFDNDSKFEEEKNKEGITKTKGYHRNIWDLISFPPLAKLFFTEDWKRAIAVYLLALFLTLYMLTKEQWFAELVKVNFGLIIGALVGKKVDDSVIAEKKN